MEQHSLSLGDICEVKSGKFAGKKVLIIKAGIQTKFGVRCISVEYIDVNSTLPEKIWVAPEQIRFEGEIDVETAEKIKEADYQEWKARQSAGVPPKSSFAPKKPWQKKSNYAKKSDGESDDSF
jgi:hypothetical protein